MEQQAPTLAQRGSSTPRLAVEQLELPNREYTRPQKGPGTLASFSSGPPRLRLCCQGLTRQPSYDDFVEFPRDKTNAHFTNPNAFPFALAHGAIIIRAEEPISSPQEKFTIPKRTIRL
jgi:hypothetical protein